MRICGSVERLEIDHIDRSLKKFTLSMGTASMPLNRFIEELKKCQLLCIIHHRIKTSLELSPEHGQGLTGKKNCRCELCRPLKNEYLRNFKEQRRRSLIGQSTALSRQ